MLQEHHQQQVETSGVLDLNVRIQDLHGQAVREKWVQQHDMIFFKDCLIAFLSREHEITQSIQRLTFKKLTTFKLPIDLISKNGLYFVTLFCLSIGMS